MMARFAANGLSAHFPSGSYAGTTGHVGPIDTVPRMPEAETTGFVTSLKEGGGAVGPVTCGGVAGPYVEVVAGVPDVVGIPTFGVRKKYQVPAATNIPTINPMMNFRIFIYSVYHKINLKFEI